MSGNTVWEDLSRSALLPLNRAGHDMYVTFHEVADLISWLTLAR